MGTPDGVSRAVHALRAVHRQVARPLAVPRPGRARLRRAAGAVRADDGRGVRDVCEVDSGDAAALRAALPAGRGGFGNGPPRRHPREGARHAARDASRRNAVKRRHLRHRTGVRVAPAAHAGEPARGSARVRGRDAGRAAQAHPRVSDPRRSAGPRRTLERVPVGGARGDGAHRVHNARGGARGARRGDAHRFRSGRRGQDRRGGAVPGLRAPRRSAAGDGAAHDRRTNGSPCFARTSASARTGGTAPAGRSSGRCIASTC